MQPADFTFAALTPTAFLDRSSSAFGDRLAVVDGQISLSYLDLAARCDHLVSALARSGVGAGDRVAALCANSHVMLELHHAVPRRGAVLVSVNIRLAPQEMAYILEHSGAKLLVATREFAELAQRLAAQLGIACVAEDAAAVGGEDYEEWLFAADVRRADRIEVDERDLLAINYTSGTTGAPKGVMYHHRGAYLQSVAMAYHAELRPGSRYLWTLPMFHCNGWCFTWAVTAAAGTHVCLRAVDTGEIWRLLTAEGVTHFSAAPTVLTMIASDKASTPLTPRVHVDTGGAPPSPSLLARLEALGLDVTHLYGLTETFGPVAVNQWQPEWDHLAPEDKSVRRARQGVSNVIARPLRVLDAAGDDVTADGATIGEIGIAGNDVMLGYYRDDEATRAVTRSGCFLTGDLAVMHPDGYVEIRDRSKDIIISGGENIASVEVERVLDAHPAVLESAVVGTPDERWGEALVAYVTLRASAEVTADDLTSFARQRLAGFKVPRRYVFGDLPKTSTGKIQKNLLRAQSQQA